MRVVVRSVLVASDDPGLFDEASRALRPDARFQVLDDLIHCNGTRAPLTNIYPVQLSPAEREGWDVASAHVPFSRSASVLIFECRSAAWVAEVGQLLARHLESPVWFVDSSDRCWPADQVDPRLVDLA